MFFGDTHMVIQIHLERPLISLRPFTWKGPYFIETLRLDVAITFCSGLTSGCCVCVIWIANYLHILFLNEKMK